MASFWKLVAIHVTQQMTEHFCSDLDPEMAKWVRLFSRLSTTMIRFNIACNDIEMLIQRLTNFSANSKGGWENLLGVAVNAVLAAGNTFKGFKEAEDIVNEIKVEWERYLTGKK